MSENRNPGLRRGAKVAGVAAAAALAVGLFSPGAANADVFVPLPDGQKAGFGYTMGLVGSSAIVSPSLASNGAGRVVWVSGKAFADVTVTPEGDPGPNNGPENDDAENSGTNNSSTHGASQINTGFIVGCQVDVGGISLGGGIGGGLDSGDGVLGALSGSISLGIGPGEVKFVSIDDKDITKPGRYAIDYQDVQMEIQGCGGFAQARSYTNIEIIGDNYIKATLYGQPFSIG
ncbi:MspA family porin [Aldersonia kunmingensis]|uniref:MspA family porin n=1 Tax=Aldersonia kunmingensis TaxID=408066 RepID=UPI0008346271|nr:MspA family porin [Aldersonia kunmingensis]